ncbi:MAG: conserved membrane protein of unknown function [Candidatus Thorarchaeota archaeon]|nr:MAG: conserved membrane protein of unknown function [Candidatus Thorarchaeota archaeon]
MIFNPLGPDHFILWDIIATFLSFFMVLIVVQINGAIQKSGRLSADVTRKVVHIFAAPVYLFSWMLFSGSALSRFFAMIVPLLFVILFVVIGTGKVVNEAFVGSMSRSGDPKELLGGTLYYALMLMIVTILWFYVPMDSLSNPTPIAFIIFGCVAGGDGLADVIGRKYGGERKFGVGGAERTVIGSVAMFIGSFLFSFILVTIFSLEVGFNITLIILPLLLLSFIATMTEAFSPKGLDNWTVPIVLVLVIVLLGIFTPSLWPYPLITL